MQAGYFCTLFSARVVVGGAILDWIFVDAKIVPLKLTK